MKSSSMKRRTFALLLTTGLAGCGALSNEGSSATKQTSVQTNGRTATTTTQTATPTKQPTTASSGNQTTTSGTQTPDESMVEVGGVSVHRQQFSLQEVPFEERPTIFVNRWMEPYCRIDASKADTLPNLRMATVDGERGHMPVRTSRSIMKLLFCYREFEREPYLDKATEISQAYMDIADRSDGALYFPYTLKKGGAGVTLKPPWYSALSQGTSLSAYLRLHEATGNEKYRRIADSIYESFKQLKRSTDGPWVAMVDDDNYLWFEEYPHDPPTHVLNGYLTGLWGLYEYWLLTKSDESRALVEAATTTVKHYLEQYRVPGEVSWYALNQGYRGNAFYHAMHILQLRKLHRITGDSYFKKMSQTFDTDHPETEGIRK